EEGANILISGGTSSGKTTFMNMLLQSIPKDKRILILEDTRELNVPHENHVHYVVSRNEKNPTLDYPQMIDHLMRSRPDIILMGELSMANSYPILRLLNSGHAGFMCTLHANSCEAALSWAIPQNIAFSGHETKGVKEFLYEAVDLVIQLHRNDQGKRYVGELLFPKTQQIIEVQA
ncbi:MAG: Flp pilus assembly complex ATPase component TadA, partial [Holosporales bacterium]|nr:Flp pilus assembly complex ATPase component TadA [Holosporales bacterium]